MKLRPGSLYSRAPVTRRCWLRGMVLGVAAMMLVACAGAGGVTETEEVRKPAAQPDIGPGLEMTVPPLTDGVAELAVAPLKAPVIQPISIGKSSDRKKSKGKRFQKLAQVAADTDTAVGHYRQAIIQDPGNHEYRLELAKLLAKSNRRIDAITEYEDLLSVIQATSRSKGKIARISLELLRIYEADKNATWAAAIRQRVIEIYQTMPNDRSRLPSLYQQQALYHMNLGALQEAEDLLRRSIDILASYNGLGQLDEHLVLLGGIYLSQGHVDHGLAALHRALAVRQVTGDIKGQGNIHLTLGRADWGREAFAAAQMHLQKALALSRQADDRAGEMAALDELGALAYDQQKYTVALDLLQKAGSVDGHFAGRAALARRHALIGYSYQNLGDHSGAVTNLRRAAFDFEKLEKKQELLTVLSGVGASFALLGRYDQAQEVLDRALLLADRKRDEGAVAQNLQNLAAVAYKQGDLPEAELLVARAAEVYEKIGNRLGLANALQALAVVRIDQKQPMRAVESLKRAIEIYREQGDVQAVSRYSGDLGGLYYQIRDDEQAERLLTQAAAVHRQAGEKKLLAQNLDNLGLLYRRLKSFPRALAANQQALALHIELGQQVEQANRLLELGGLHHQFGKHDPALDFMHRALKKYEELREKKRMAETLEAIGLTHMRLTNHVQARSAFERAWNLSLESGDQKSIARALGNLGRYHLHQKNMDEAEKHLRQALSANRELGESGLAAANLRGLSDIAVSRGDPETGEELRKQAVKIYQKIDQAGAVADTLMSMASRAMIGERYDQAEAWINEAMALYDDEGLAVGLSIARADLGNLRLRRGDPGQAEKLFQQALEQARTLTEKHERAAILKRVGGAYHDQEDWDRACPLFEQARALYRQSERFHAATRLHEHMAEHECPALPSS